MYNKKDYKNIYYLVLNDRLGESKKYHELMPYERILSLLIKSTAVNDYAKYAEECVKLVYKLGENNIYVDSTLINLCFISSGSYHALSRLELIFYPKDVINKYNFGYFLSSFISLFYTYAGFIKSGQTNLSYRYRKLDDIFRYVYNLCDGKNYTVDQMSIILTLVSKIYVEDLDYDLLESSLIDPDYCLMNNLAVGTWAKDNYYHSYYKKIYDMAEQFINKNHKEIL